MQDYIVKDVFNMKDSCLSHFSFNSKQPSITSDTFHYKRGAGQVFQQSSHVLDPSMFEDEDVGILLVIPFNIKSILYP